MQQMHITEGCKYTSIFQHTPFRNFFIYKSQLLNSLQMYTLCFLKENLRPPPLTFSDLEQTDIQGHRASTIHINFSFIISLVLFFKY